MTESDSGKTVEANVGESLELSLKENPSTGYRWAVETLDSRVFAAQDGKFAQSSGAMGDGGSMKWVLKAVGPGKTDFRLKLWRQWEGEASVQKRFNVTLIAH